MIIEWPLLWQFNDARDVIIASQTDISEVVDDDDIQMLGNVLNLY